jgi:hypothetical protein
MANLAHGLQHRQAGQWKCDRLANNDKKVAKIAGEREYETNGKKRNKRKNEKFSFVSSFFVCSVFSLASN